jgi:hypothetical protein
MVCYVYDCNYVKVIPIKSRSASEWVKEYDTIHQELTVKGFKPKLQTLDNEASAALKNFFTANDENCQLMPPHCHRRNAAERAIRFPATPFARPHIRTEKSKRPESHLTKECARARVRRLKTEPNYYYCPITLGM